MADRYGAWEVLDVLGRGGMGVVFRARDPLTDAEAAIKTVATAEPVHADALRREIAALRDLRHPGVPALLEAGPRDDTPWYAMELVPGSTLRVWAGALPREAAVDVTRPLDRAAPTAPVP